MNASDKPEFTAQMQRLCAGYDIGYTDLRRDVYFESLSKMGLIQFSQCVDLLLSARSPFKEKIPKAPQMWAVWDKVKEERKHQEQMRPKAPPPEEPRASMWQRMLDGRMLQYIHRRRAVEKVTGEINIRKRWTATRSLGETLEQLAKEGTPAEPDEIDRMFKAAMDAIQDVA